MISLSDINARIKSKPSVTYQDHLPGCKHFGNGAISTASAAVTKDVAPCTIMTTCPAVPKAEHFHKDIAEQVEQSQWWNSSLAELMIENARMLAEPPLHASSIPHKDNILDHK